MIRLYSNLLLLLSILLCNVSESLSQKYYVDAYHSGNGYLSNQSFCVLKDRTGYVWVGTESGLARFDGHNFKFYRSDPDSVHTFSSNYIKKIIIDRHDRIWAIADNRINIFSIADEKVNRLNWEINGKQANQVTDLYYDYQNDAVWVASNDGIYYTQGEHIDLHRQTISNLNPKFQTGYINIDHHKRFWITNTYGIYRYDDELCILDSIHRVGNNPLIINDDFYMNSFLENDETLWVGNWIYGLTKVNTENMIIENYRWNQNPKVQQAVFSFEIFRENEDVLWVGTLDGIKMFNKETKSFKEPELLYKNQQKIADLDITGLYVHDKELWISSTHQLHKLDVSPLQVSFFPIPYNDNSEIQLPTHIQFVHSNIEKSDSLLYFIGMYRGLNLLNIKSQKLLSLPLELQIYTTPDHYPNMIYLDHDNRLWLATKGKGIAFYNLITKEYKKLDIVNETRFDEYIHTINQGSDGTVWFGCFKGLYYYDSNTQKIYKDGVLANLKSKSLIPPLANHFIIDQSDRLWIIHNDDDALASFLLIYDPKSKTTQKINYSDHRVLRQMNHLESIIALDSNQYLLSSQNGLAILFMPTKFDLQFTLYQDLQRSKLNCTEMVRKDDNTIYLSCEGGVIEFNLLTRKICRLPNYYFRNSALSMPHIALSSITKNLFISEENGLDIIPPANDKREYKHKIHLTELTINNENIPIQKMVDNSLILPADKNNLVFSFSNLQYSESNLTQYYYTLDNDSSRWELALDNRIRFDNLGSGNYTLRVKSVDYLGIESDNDYFISIIIKPPFYKALWFLILVSLAIIVIVILLFKVRENQRKKLENLRVLIARDLHDDMGSSLSFIKLLSEIEYQKNHDNKAFEMIAVKSSEVMETMSEIIWSINPSKDRMIDVVEKVISQTAIIAETKGIYVTIDEYDIQDSSMIKPDQRRQIYLLCKEAVHNIIKHAKASHITLKFSSTNTHTSISIIDNGQGFDINNVQLGNGINNMRERAKKINANLTIVSSNIGTRVLLIV